MLIVEAGDLALLIHLMSAGRLQLWDKRASLRDRASRLLVRIADGRELRLREFGTQQRAWAKLFPRTSSTRTSRLRHSAPTRGPHRRSSVRGADRPAAPPPFAVARPARDRRHRALVGGRDPLGDGAVGVQGRQDLDAAEVARLRIACEEVLGRALDHYEDVIGETMPDKMPMPLKVHRHTGEPCPRCGTTLEAVHFRDYVTTYCPAEQTGGRVLKDRRLRAAQVVGISRAQPPRRAPTGPGPAGASSGTS